MKIFDVGLSGTSPIKTVNNVYQKNDPRPVLECIINGQKLHTLYDTGAMLSLLRQSAWTDKFEKNMHMLKRINFRLQNGSEKDYFGPG